MKKLGVTHSQIVTRIMTERRVEFSSSLFLYEAAENLELVLVGASMIKYPSNVQT